MKLVHPELECQLNFSKTSLEWVIENPKLMANYVYELYAQIHGLEGQFVLSVDNEEKNLEKVAEILFDPFTVNFNDRKVLNKLYAQLSEYAIGEEMYLQTQEVVASLQRYFLILEQCNEYMLEIETDIDILNIFKILGIKLTDYADDFFDNLLSYVKIVSNLMGKHLLVFVNFSSYLSENQINELIKTAAYNEIKLLFIENIDRSYFGGCSRYIIDRDNCEILG